MKTKVTKTAIKANYPNILGVSYCALQWLLKYQEPFGYSARAEGWACDYYDVGGLLISTGYGPLNGNCEADYDLIKRYDDAARGIVCDYSKDYNQQKEAINKLLDQFVKEVLPKG